MAKPFRFPADTRHRFAGTEIHRDRQLSFRLNGRRISAYEGDTVLSALLASGIDAAGLLGKSPVRLGESFAPLLRPRKGSNAALPMVRVLATDGADWVTTNHRPFWRLPMQRGSSSLDLPLLARSEHPWQHERPTQTRTADLVVVGGGVAGMAAALEAAAHGRTVLLVERRTFLGGDATLYGQFGDEESPEALTARLKAEVAAHPAITLLTATEAFGLEGPSVLAHQVEQTTTGVQSAVTSLEGRHVLLATGGRHRLPVFPGNRLPGVVPLAEAYHFAERYGIGFGHQVVVATQANWGYRAALRLADAGLAVQRIADARPIVHSRFIDFAKASGLLLAPGQTPHGASLAAERLQVTFGRQDTEPVIVNTDALLVAGAFQPALSLWLLAGGQTEWTPATHRLEARGQLPHIALAGSAAGFRSLLACEASGRAAEEMLFGGASARVTDRPVDERFETRDGPTPVSSGKGTAPAFLDDGASLLMVPQPATRLPPDATALSIGEVAALVELGTLQPDDAGAIAEERSTPTQDLPAANWSPPAIREPSSLPPYLEGRFGPDPIRALLKVDRHQQFEVGALVYRNTGPRHPANAIGVITAPAPASRGGGVALINRQALAGTDRFIVDTLRRPWPARLIRPLDATAASPPA